jgi:hypothetical protein
MAAKTISDLIGAGKSPPSSAAVPAAVPVGVPPTAADKKFPANEFVQIEANA